MANFLDKQHTIARPDFNRWLVPPAAVAIHLSIGMAYGFSVFWLPLSRAIGITAPAVGDWKISTLGWTFTLFIAVLGLAAAIFGGWVERNGPRKAAVVAAFCWSGGLFLAALGVYYHQILLLWLGGGVVGGCGLGLAYISPISTLIKWFPDKRGMATGMAIMGFGGGAMIGAPLADKLMNHFATPTSVGVWQTFVVLGVIYLIAMLAGAFAYRIPPVGWQPHGWTPPPKTGNSMITHGHVHVNKVFRTPQFWLLWAALCFNVSATIGVIGMASPMLQEIFGGKLLGVTTAFAALTLEQKAKIASIGAGFAGLLSLFNIGGRFFWSSLSDHIGRKTTFFVFFVLGIAAYLAAVMAGKAQHIALFVVMFCIILSMYGGGFAAIPAYLADLFGTQFVSAIQGRILTAWATAGVVGPVLINYLREAQLRHGMPSADAYNLTLYISAGLLLLGLFCNLLVRPVADKFLMTAEELAKERQHGLNGAATTICESLRPAAASWLAVACAWASVGLPLTWGIFKTVEKASAFFR